MTRFESEPVVLNTTCEEVYSFLSDFRKLNQVMPEQIINWKATQDSCSFTIQGLTDLSMRLASKSDCRNIHIVSEGKNPIEYSMDYFFRKKDDSRCEVIVLLDAELNAFLKMMASRPLQNLVDMIAGKLKELY
jgi:carbon monoxide dehydrogenase subunit G